MYDREHAIRTALAPWSQFVFFAVMLAVLFGSRMIGGHQLHLVALALFAFVAFIAKVALSTRYEPRRVRVEGDMLHVGDLTLARSSLERGCFVPTYEGSSAKVALKTKRGAEIDIRVTDEGEARELLSVLGLDVGQHAARFAIARMPRSFDPATSAIAVGLGACVAVAGALLALGWATPVVIGVVALMLKTLFPMGRRGNVDVGRDGVLLSNGFGHRFYPWADVNELRAIDGGVELALRDGRMLPLRVLGRKRDSEGQAEHVAMFTRMTAARAARTDGDSDADVDLAPRLERRDQGLRAWLASLARGAVEADYRSAVLRTEDLLTTLEHHASRVARVAAAIVLSKRGDAERERVRVVAGACADPKLRIALDAVLSGADEVQLEEAVEAIELEDGTSSIARRGSIS